MFSERLKLAVRKLPRQVASPVALARLFGEQYLVSVRRDDVGFHKLRQTRSACLQGSRGGGPAALTISHRSRETTRDSQHQ
jgi:hypothetical protein